MIKKVMAESSALLIYNNNLYTPITRSFAALFKKLKP
jgi:hypothetical protein